MTKNNKYKEDWIECELGEISLIERGGSPRPIKDYLTNGDGVNWIKIGDATNSGKYILETEQKIKPSGLIKSREVFPGDVLLSNSMSFGRPYIMGINGAIHDGWLVIRSNKYINKDFLYYLLSSPYVFQQFSRNAKGSTVKNLNIKIVSDVTVKIPPLPIQHAIVKKIEALFSSLDSGIADLKKAKEQLKIYRQAVLKKAFEGELTKEWRGENNKRIWEKSKIDEITLINPKPNKKEINENLEIQFLPMKLVEEIINKIHLSETRLFKDVQKKSYTYFENNDILFAKVTPCMENGKIAIARKLKNGIGYGSSEFHVIRCNDSILNEFLFYYLIQDKFRSEAQHAMTGAVGLRRVPKDFIKDYEIPLPPLPEQHQIVKEIESRLSVCDAVEKNIEDSLEKAELLRQSILKQAFEGKLLSKEEIKKCKEQPDYEPASKLLEKIKKNNEIMK